MTDLVEFLRARLDTDELTARVVEDGPGEIPRRGLDPMRVSVKDEVRFSYLTIDPARVLREVEAKREFLEFAVRTRDLAEQQPTEGQARELCVKWAAYLTALKFDALRYADHPDYREEWRP